MNNHYNAVVFDMDDTLIKTFEVKWRQHQHFARERYGVELHRDTFCEHWGKPFHSFLDGLYGGLDDLARVPAEYLKFSHLFPVQLHDDTITVLDRLHEAGKKLGIVTATSREVVMHDLGVAGFPLERLHKLQTADDTSVHKPHPDVFAPMLTALKDAGIHSNILYVGDALTDYYAARDAGLDFVGVTTGQVCAEQFRDAGVRHVVDRLGGVPDLVLRPS